ncbi:MAG: hypothetical protein E4H10_05240 [Bacteroidia bacterium]|nr:MAG: hypothetical protein E4H10_05240 [Bacteroidia bacterium]
MVLLLLAVPVLSLLFLQNRQVQTKVSKILAEKLSEELRATISLSSVNYSFFKRIQVRDIYIEDIHGDTLIYAELAKLRIKNLRSDQKGIEIRKAALENTYVNLVIDSSNVVNIKYFTDLLKKDHVPPERKGRFHFGEITMTNGRFSLSRMNAPPVRSDIAFSDFDLSGLEITVEDLIYYMDTTSMNILSLSAMEKSGFNLEQLATFFSIGKKHMHFYDLEVNTGGSELHVPKLTFNFEQWKLFKHFSREVDLSFESRQSLLLMDDLSHFASGTEGLIDRVSMDGSVHGKLSSLKGDELFVTFDQNTTLAFDFVMIGLPDFRSTFLDFNFRELNSSVTALHDLLVKGNYPEDQLLYPWINLGNLDFKGQFTGYPDNFVAAGYMLSDMGEMVMDLSFKPDSLGIQFEGHLSTGDFMLGEFLDQQKMLSQLDMDVLVDGNLYQGEIRANLNGTIDTLVFSQYAYSNITLDGALSNKTFDGGFSISDPNIRMDFEGEMDFSEEVPTYNFTADVARARPHFLNLGIEDPNSFASFLVEIDMTGRTLDELNGEIRLVNSLFERKGEQVQLYDMNLTVRNTSDTSLILVESELFDATIGGHYRLSELPESFRSLADEYINMVPGTDLAPDSSNHFTYHFDLKRVNPILDFFYPTLQIGEESQIRGEYDPSSGIFSTTGLFPNLGVGPGKWANVEMVSEIALDEFHFLFQSDSLIYGKNYALENQHFNLFTSQDTAHLEVFWENQSEPRYRGAIKLTGAFQPDSIEERGFLVEVEPSSIVISDEDWEVHRASVLFRKKLILVDSLSVKSQERYLVADGTLSSDGDQDFNLDFRNLNLNELSSVAGINADLEGSITGILTYRKMDGSPYIFSDLSVDTLWFNKQLMGPTTLNAAWDDSRKNINMVLHSNLNKHRTIEVDGDFTPEGKLLDFDIHLNELGLQTLDRYTGNLVSDLSGTGDVSLTLDGTLKQPKLNGTVDFNQGSATISYLNTRYQFDDPLRIYNNNLYLENFTAFDKFGNTAEINGTVSNNFFRDFYTSIHIEARNLMCMNTSSLDNDVFYGSIFATGNVGISGEPEAMRLSINATTERNTAIYLPLYNAREVQQSDFISFIRQDDLEPEELTAVKKLGGLEMELDVEVTEEAVVQMIFDPKVGDIIETSGRGNLRILKDQNQGFRMFGDVELLEGDYLFTLQNVINKRFEIEPGGRISFSGAPTNASIDLAAIYRTRAAPYNLYPGDPSDDKAESLKKRIPVECHLNLVGELQSPNIVTGIKMPTANTETRDYLESATSTEEDLMKQFLSLLVINNFYSVSGFGIQDMGTMNSSIAGVTASELLSNQLSNWLSQISDDFDIGFNYRPGDQVTSQEVEVALSTQLLNDRVIISGNVDVGGQETNPSSSSANNPYIMGDFEVEYKITSNISVLAFNRARDELIFETAPYKQGVGVSYREDFNDLKQLMARYREGLTNRKKKKKKSDPAELEE